VENIVGFVSTTLEKQSPDVPDVTLQMVIHSGESVNYSHVLTPVRSIIAAYARIFHAPIW
jgi:hypothetical protein